MNIDERIKRELQSKANETDTAFEPKQGMFSLVAAAYQGGLGRWVILISIITLVVSVFLLWSGYRFFSASVLTDQVYWGFCLVVSLMAQLGLKQWIWMEMNRNSLLREIKRLEAAVDELGKR